MHAAVQLLRFGQGLRVLLPGFRLTEDRQLFGGTLAGLDHRGLATQAGLQMGEADSGSPKELYINEHWDRFIDLTVRRGVYGVLAGGAVAILLARGPSTRAAAVAFGAGVGVGSAYTDSQRALRK